MNRVELGFLSLTGTAPSGRDAEYLAWHALDHMPEQYALPGMLNGQRWRSTGPCRDQRAVGVAGYDVVDNVVCYLMGAPARETLDRFVALGRTLADKGRYPEVVPSRLVGAFELLDAHAAARVLVSPEVVPWRPNLGIYLIVEELTDRAAAAPFLRWAHTDGVPSLLSCPGVAGVWWFGTAARFAQPMFSKGEFRVTVCYLDADPATVGAALAPIVRERWRHDGVEARLAAPFESVVRWDWERFFRP